MGKGIYIRGESGVGLGVVVGVTCDEWP